jgi:predicted lipoprotein with Yx(FWY)xxD motif
MGRGRRTNSEMTSQSSSKSVLGVNRALGAPMVLCVLGLVAAGCGGAGATTKSQVAAPTRASGASVTAARPGVTVKVMQTQYGRVLVDGNGRALYLFTRDRAPTSQCYRACAGNWPPFLTTGTPAAGIDAQAGLLGTTRRRDGATQVTYRGHPLYYYVGDHHPGEVLCQAVEEFGGFWYVVTRRGSAVL